jgi:hypothetical protein
MDQAQMEFETALDMARRGREMWLEDHTMQSFKIWRDSSETAHRWHRTLRLAGHDPALEGEDELERILDPKWRGHRP